MRIHLFTYHDINNVPSYTILHIRQQHFTRTRIRCGVDFIKILKPTL